VREWKQQEFEENCVAKCSIVCNLQQNDVWWNGRGWMCLARRGRVMGAI